MKRVSRSMVFSATLALLPMAAFAEGGCPDGFYPQQGQGWRTCVPMGNSNGGYAPASPPVVVRNKFGAVAVGYEHDEKGRRVGVYSFKNSSFSQDDADRSALQACQSGGGTCEIGAQFVNSCAAVVQAGANIFNGVGNNAERARLDGIARCAALGWKESECKVADARCN